jgi:hypothetical protein
VLFEVFYFWRTVGNIPKRFIEAKAGEEGRSLEEELPIDERIIKFAYSLDKSNKSLWNITDGSPKIKNFKEHFHLLHFCFLQQQGVTE